MQQDDFLELYLSFWFQVKTAIRTRMQSTLPGIALMHVKTMRFVFHHPDTSQQEITKHFDRDKAQVTRLVKELVAEKLILRKQDTADKRKYHLRLSRKGHSVFKQANEIMLGVETELLGNMSAREINAHRDTMKKMLTTLQEINR